MSFNIDDQGFTGINVPFDPKLCNYWVDGEDGDYGSFKIDTVEEFLSRVSFEYRTPEKLITFLVPKAEHSPAFKCNNVTSLINALVAEFDGKIYSFVGGIENINFIETPIFPKFISEVALGAVNGVNKVFSSTYNFRIETVTVFLNGLKESNFLVLTDKTIELNQAPLNTGFTDKIEITYFKK